MAETKAQAARRSRLKRQYSITPEEYEIILAFQGGVCPICEEERNKKGEIKLLGVDHNHKDGLVRGVLCFYCNRKLPEWWTLERAKRVVAFLENPPATQALGEPRYGRVGRTTNKGKRKRKNAAPRKPKSGR